jgi:hypothetical protein
MGFKRLGGLKIAERLHKISRHGFHIWPLVGKLVEGQYRGGCIALHSIGIITR